MIVRSNNPAQNANRNLGINNSNVAKTLEKLSSGLRINRAADDAAGLAISEKMRGQIRGLAKGINNVEKGINLINTAEDSADVIHDILLRMRELAVQSSNGTYQDEDRAQIDLEYQALKSEIDRIAKSTNYNGIILLDGRHAKDNASTPEPVAANAFAVEALSAAQANSAILNDSFIEQAAILNDLPEIAAIASASAPVPDVEININNPTSLPAGVTFSNGVLRITNAFDSNKNIRINGTGQTTNRIEVQSGVTSTIILNNVNISTSTGAALDMRGATVNLWLEGNNNLRSNTNSSPQCAGIQTTNGILTIDGTGTLTAWSSNQAGIGGGQESGGGGGTVIINGGDITAESAWGVGIGGGDTSGVGGRGADITVNGGIVRAKGTYKPGGLSTPGFGIGGGYSSGDGGTLTITGGAVIVDGLVGGGVNGGKGADVRIEGGLLEIANGWIGGGAYFSGSAIGSNGTTTITGGNLSITNPATNIRGGVEDSTGTDAFRVQIMLFDSSGNEFMFPPYTEVTYTLDGEEINAVTDAQGRLYMYVQNGKSHPTNPLGIMTQADNPTLGLPGDLYGWLLTQQANHNDALTFAQDIGHIPPIISGEAVRDDDDSATVNFNSNFEGTYHYIVRDSSDPSSPTADEILASPNSGNAVIGANTFDLDGLTTGTHRVFIILVTEDDRNSNVLRLTIPPVGNPADPPVDPPIDPPTDPGTANRDTGGLIIQYGANSNESLNVFIGDMRIEALGIATTAVDPWEAANEAIDYIDKSVNLVSAERANLGAFQNRLEHILNNNALTHENLTASESAIRDLDMAKGMMELTKNNILSQSAQAMLAQAQQLPQSVLSLMQ